MPRPGCWSARWLVRTAQSVRVKYVNAYSDVRRDTKLFLHGDDALDNVQTVEPEVANELGVQLELDSAKNQTQ